MCQNLMKYTYIVYQSHRICFYTSNNSSFSEIIAQIKSSYLAAVRAEVGLH